MGYKKKLNIWRKKDLKKKRSAFWDEYWQLMKKHKMGFVPTFRIIDGQTVQAQNTIKPLTDEVLEKMEEGERMAKEAEGRGISVEELMKEKEDEKIQIKEMSNKEIKDKIDGEKRETDQGSAEISRV
ncbi:hypothetical protein MYX07_00315 [Patescibacteria group bacterium AH-259-L07]|nr:hypothetical protein [Patescibacteria group bacterium AH-259-L07]